MLLNKHVAVLQTYKIDGKLRTSSGVLSQEETLAADNLHFTLLTGKSCVACASVVREILRLLRTWYLAYVRVIPPVP